VSATAQPRPDPGDRLEQARAVFERLGAHLRSALVGRDALIERVSIALLADGHVLLEDRPGSGKTTLAKALGAALSAEDAVLPVFRRVQFTPDLLPSDVTGASIFQAETGSFRFQRGPVFTHVLLADELNRTPPKVQAALLEAMAEKQVTCDGQTHPLDALFCVIATQNPLDRIGTYPLPLPQLDRFLFRIPMTDLARDAELEVLARYSQPGAERQAAAPPPLTRAELLGARDAIHHCVRVAREIQECLVDSSRALRSDERIAAGNSTRSLVLLLPALQARAVAQGRDFVSSEDIEELLPQALAHRILLAPGVGDAHALIAEAMEAPLERLSRATLRRVR